MVMKNLKGLTVCAEAETNRFENDNGVFVNHQKTKSYPVTDKYKKEPLAQPVGCEEDQLG